LLSTILVANTVSSPRFSVSKFIILLIVGLTVLFFWYRNPKLIGVQGNTMGTTYSINVFIPRWKFSSGLDERIASRLAQLQAIFSTYDPDSELSKFNTLKTRESVVASDDLYRVLEKAKRIYKETHGAWDPTVYPLVTLWGFGPQTATGNGGVVPKAEQIKRAKASVGFSKIHLQRERHIRKTDSRVQLDLSSIAKGYAVDEIVRLLWELDVSHYYVEIGGEVRVSKQKPNGKPWKIGISDPNPGSRVDSVIRVVSLSGKAMATSGDYRHYFEVGGKRYSHILDPRTGFPVSFGLVSVSVIANTCMEADALATAMMVMGREEGLAYIERHTDLEGLFIEKDDSGKLQFTASSGLP